MNNSSEENISDEFETIARETLDRIIEIIENENNLEIDVNNTDSEIIDNIEIHNLDEELDTFNEEIINERIEIKPISSDILNKSLRLINLEEFENSPTTGTIRQGLRSNRNTIHTEYIQPKRIVKAKKMIGGTDMKPISALDAIKLIPNFSGQSEIYPFLHACEVIISTVDSEQHPFMLKMIAATKLSDRAFNVTRYKEIVEWGDMKIILLDAFETPYGAANLQIELNIVKTKHNETICAYNNRVEEIYQKLCNTVAIDKTPTEAKILRDNIREQSLVSYKNGLSDQIKFEVKTKNPTTLEQAMKIALITEKNIRTYNDVQDIFRANNTYSNRNTHQNRQFNNNNQNTAYNYRNNDNNNNINRNNTYDRNTNRNPNPRNNNFNVRRCHTCNREGHFSSQCRMNNVAYNSRPPNQNNFHENPN
ncbi:putative actin-fragmin kinase DDB_G0287957 [Metopolophium dirhodum]|uniref:putative actin-fragmin kinase DDB_G0287957 n=1 Tax=Metopolophium dirhodum TaxID=44670 RepID=UPI00298F8107|nr:putative actin-fragmin kinase DDB_G0287957 [Metopolophium dirhodum]